MQILNGKKQIFNQILHSNTNYCLLHDVSLLIYYILLPSIYINRFVGLSVSVLRFVCPPGTNNSCTQEREEQTFSNTGGGEHFHIKGGDKHFCIEWGTNIFIQRRGQPFHIGGYEDVIEERDVSEANFLVFRGP